MQMLNLIREFELQRMKESKTIKEYSNKLLTIVNKVKLLGTTSIDSKIVEKILVLVPERYEESITTLENIKDLFKITMTELLNVLNVLQAQEQRRLMRPDRYVEGALPTTHQDSEKDKNKFFKKNQASSNKINANQFQNNGRSLKKGYSPCQYCDKTDHSPFKCWKRLDARCNKCNQLVHVVVISKTKPKKQEANTEVVDQDDEV
jgi:hypothetical protein